MKPFAAFHSSARRCLAGIAMLAAFIAAQLGMSAPAAAQTKDAITIAANLTAVNHMWAYWGKERGFFAKQGLDVTIIDNVADPVAALASGQVMFVAHGAQLHQGAIRGVPIKAVMVTARDNLGVYAGPAIKSIQDLRGKRIIAPFDSLKDVLRRNGVDPDKDVNWVVGRGAPIVNLQLVKKGDADAFASFPSSRSQAEGLGLHEVFRVGQFVPGGPVSIVGTSSRLIAENPQLVMRVIHATLDTLADMRANKEAVMAYTMRVMNYDKGSAETYATIVNDVPADGLVSDDALRITLDSTKRGQNNTQNIPLSQVWDFSLLQQVLKTRK